MPTSHYFDTDPVAASKPETVRLALPDMTLELTTDHGVFSRLGVDRGTDLLLRSIPAPPADGHLLDLGCGYGPIALAVARRAPGARVWAMDVNNRALELVGVNAARSEAGNVTAIRPDQVPADIRFAAIYSNPPIKIGKELLHGLLSDWIGRLAPGGQAHLVVHRHLGSDSLARWLAAEGFTVDRVRSKMGYRILAVTARCTAPRPERA